MTIYLHNGTNIAILVWYGCVFKHPEHLFKVDVPLNFKLVELSVGINSDVPILYVTKYLTTLMYLKSSLQNTIWPPNSHSSTLTSLLHKTFWPPISQFKVKKLFCIILRRNFLQSWIAIKISFFLILGRPLQSCNTPYTEKHCTICFLHAVWDHKYEWMVHKIKILKFNIRRQASVNIHPS